MMTKSLIANKKNPPARSAILYPPRPPLIRCAQSGGTRLQRTLQHPRRIEPPPSPRPARPLGPPVWWWKDSAKEVATEREDEGSVGSPGRARARLPGRRPYGQVSKAVVSVTARATEPAAFS